MISPTYYGEDILDVYDKRLPDATVRTRWSTGPSYIKIYSHGLVEVHSPKFRTLCDITQRLSWAARPLNKN